MRYCRDGTKSYCERNGLDFEKLFSEGLPPEAFDHLDDVFTARLLAAARERVSGKISKRA
jgi:hypothetical protein